MEKNRLSTAERMEIFRECVYSDKWSEYWKRNKFLFVKNDYVIIKYVESAPVTPGNIITPRYSYMLEHWDDLCQPFKNLLRGETLYNEKQDNWNRAKANGLGYL